MRQVTYLYSPDYLDYPSPLGNRFTVVCSAADSDKRARLHPSIVGAEVPSVRRDRLSSLLSRSAQATSRQDQWRKPATGHHSDQLLNWHQARRHSFPGGASESETDRDLHLLKLSRGPVR